MRNICFNLLIATLFLVTGCTAPQKEEKTTYKIASYNLRMDTERDSINAWPNRKEMVNSLIVYHDFDIMGTQEGFIHQLKDITKIPYLDYVGAGRDDGKEAGEHSAIFYNSEKFEVLDKGDFWFSENPETPGLGWDATCCNRICSWAKFKDKAKDHVFYVFNSHFDHQGVKAREESGKLLVSKIEEIAKGEKVIITGDFNSTPDTEQIKLLQDSFNDAYKHSEEPPYGPVGTFNAFKWNSSFDSRIDYIFVSSDIKVLKYGVLTDSKENRYPSDHYPVIADVVLN